MVATDPAKNPAAENRSGYGRRKLNEGRDSQIMRAASNPTKLRDTPNIRAAAPKPNVPLRTTGLRPDLSERDQGRYVFHFVVNIDLTDLIVDPTDKCSIFELPEPRSPARRYQHERYDAQFSYAADN
jgi:hypothetical protein